MPLKLRCKVWIENEVGQPIIGEGRMRILSTVRLTGSISKAARKLNLPYPGRVGKDQGRGEASRIQDR